jgi:hypothetical protein
MIEQPCQLGTIPARARELLFVNTAAAGLGERGALKVEVLVVGRNPRVAEQHRRNLIANVIAKCYLFATEFCNAGTATLSVADPQSRNLGVLRRLWIGCFLPFFAVPPLHLERLFMPHSSHSQRLRGSGRLGWRAAYIRTTDEWLGGGLEPGHCLKFYRVISKLTFWIVPVKGKEPLDL